MANLDYRAGRNSLSSIFEASNALYDLNNRKTTALGRTLQEIGGSISKYALIKGELESQKLRNEGLGLDLERARIENEFLPKKYDVALRMSEAQINTELNRADLIKEQKNVATQELLFGKEAMRYARSLEKRTKTLDQEKGILESMRGLIKKWGF